MQKQALRVVIASYKDMTLQQLLQELATEGYRASFLILIREHFGSEPPEDLTSEIILRDRRLPPIPGHWYFWAPDVQWEGEEPHLSELSEVDNGVRTGLDHLLSRAVGTFDTVYLWMD